MATETRQFDPKEISNKALALREVLKEFPASLLLNFEYNSRRGIATFDTRAVPIVSRDPDPESQANKDLDAATEATNQLALDLKARIAELDGREQELINLRANLIRREQGIDEKQTQLDQSIKALKRLQLGFFGNIRSFFHTRK